MKQESIFNYSQDMDTVTALHSNENIRYRQDDDFDEEDDNTDEEPDLDEPGPEEDLEREPNPQKDKEQQEYNTPHPDISRDQPKAN